MTKYVGELYYRKTPINTYDDMETYVDENLTKVKRKEISPTEKNDNKRMRTGNMSDESGEEMVLIVPDSVLE